MASITHVLVQCERESHFPPLESVLASDWLATKNEVDFKGCTASSWISWDIHSGESQLPCGKPNYPETTILESPGVVF